ncbi:uncharacterized protein PgNI_08486 [Pyricularia grisea]|uniref:AB hydrolase-1 domain-containing protein n=1 Tax=Pyricularia grisea TaxID=148305 RepID=A0A6P8AU50_PYRGI|nr:uncharacterized protein PgNI_08486 [Pyricularia grisea]TLD05737.1 hypothetical protein PgNI_08486 [Pyricularia grisea]
MIPWWQAILPVVVPIGTYVAFLGLLAVPAIQRFALYANRVSTLLFTNLDEPERWGFAKNQVTPFKLKVPDGEVLYGWHVLPLRTYASHENVLLKRPRGCSDDFSTTDAFRILKDDPEAKVVISCMATQPLSPAPDSMVTQAMWPRDGDRPTDYSPSTHLITIDYRGFGKSTGSPTETGMLVDGMAIVDYVLDTIGIPPSRVVIFGHSLGTAVTSAVAERYASRGIDFAAIILVASFSSLPDMLSGYRIGGVIGVMRPLAAICPPLNRFFLGTFVVDKWDSAGRVTNMVRSVKARAGKLRLRIIHAHDDWDIPCIEADKMFTAAVGGLIGVGVEPQRLAEMKDERTVWKCEKAFATRWEEGDVHISEEIISHGGHNEALFYAPSTLALIDAFEESARPEAHPQ